MKKKINEILLILACLIIMPAVIFADDAGGTGSGGGAGGTGGSSGGSNSMYWQSGTQSQVRVAAYRFDLVYKPKNGNRYILKTVVAQDNSSDNAGSWCGTGRSFLKERVKEYTSAVNATGGNAVYVESGPLVELARRLSNGEKIDDIFNDNKIIDEEIIKLYIRSSLGFNIDPDEMTLEQDDNPGTYDSFGYRILIQQIQVFASGAEGQECSSFYKFAATRKDVTGDSKLLRRLTGNSLPVEIAPYRVQGIGEDLWTTRPDIGISSGEVHAFKPNETGPQIRNKAKYFADWNNGLGYNILWFSNDQFSYDYSVDAACVNCESDNTDNKAYIIQDITDWDAILASRSSDNENVKEYYHKGNGVYCREEYTVYFPNTNNTIYVEPGRYFTLNPSAEALDKIVSSAAIPNMKPVKVVKKRQCRVNSEENSSNSTTVLDSFRRKSEYDFKGKTGTVSFKYNERYEDSRYNMDNMEELSVYEEPNNYTYSIDNGTLNMEVTRYYTLPSNYYQYIRKQDGLSMKVKPSANLGHYINVGIPNLPVSFNNTGDNGIAADIQFLFELPTNDQYSKLDEAYKADNSYLKTGEDSSNIYKRYDENKLREGEDIRSSACAKMFGDDNQNFKTCVNNRQNNSIGDIDKNANCIVNSKITTSTRSGYSCIVLTPKETDDCSSEDDANRLGLDWNPYNQTCCPVGTTYNPTLGKCESNNETCRIENGKYYDFDGNEITKEEYDRICPNSENGDTCRIENGKYYDFDGNEITKEEYDRICPSNLPPTCETDGDCPYGCCPSGECAPMPDGTCPGSGGIDVIYRTIDLVNPFPGQNAEQRNTGANWCSYNIRTQKIDCKYNNQTVKNYITREKGGTEHGGEVYREDHVLYEVTLDSSTIGKVRDYNDSHKYDDWDLDCLDNGRACISDFLRDQVTTTGKCSRASKSTFYTCDEDV